MEVNCIFACGSMRSFTAPLVWRKREENTEIIINAQGRICDICGAVALDPYAAKKLHDMLIRFIREIEEYGVENAILY